MVILFEHSESDEVIADVKYNNDLDMFDGDDHFNPDRGRHLGFGQLDDGRFYLVFGTEYKGQHNYAVVVPAERIVKEALKSHNLHVLENYPELTQIYNDKYNKINPEKKSKVFSIRVKLTEPKEDTDEKVQDLIERVSKYKDLQL